MPNQSPYTVTNLDDYKKLTEQLFEVLNQLQNFEFKFLGDQIPSTILEVKDIAH